METSSNSSRASDNFSVFEFSSFCPSQEVFCLGGSLNSSSIFVIAALRLKSELNFEEVFLAKSRKVV